MRIPSLILAAVAATLLTGPASSQEKADQPGKDKAEGSTKKVKELQKERIATLKMVVEISEKLAKSARIEIGDLLEAKMSLLKAELDAAEKESDRIALYKTAIDSLKEYEALAKAQFEAGRATELYVHRAKATRLEVEIALEKAKDKEAKRGK
jgi:outer membrane protein TolC